MEEKILFSIIKNLLKKAYCSQDIKEDLFQDLYLYYLQIEKKYTSEMNVPFEAFIVKFLKWRMWTLIKSKYLPSIYIGEESDALDYREIEEVDLSPLIEGLANVSAEDLTLLILKHIGNKSYTELSCKLGLSIEGIRKKIIKLERKIKWAGKSNQITKKEK